MKKDTFVKLKDEFPIILTATAVSLLSFALYNSHFNGILATLKIAFLSLFYSLIAIGVIYLIFWLNYRVSERARRHFKNKK